MRKGRCQISVGSKAIQNADSAGGGSMGKMRFIIICIPHTRNALSAKGQIQVVMYTIGTIRKWKVGNFGLWVKRHRKTFLIYTCLNCRAFSN